MATNWDTYYAVLLSAVLALAIPGILSVASHILGRQKNLLRDQKLPEVQFPAAHGKVGSQMGQHLNIRANRSVSTAMLFVLLTLVLIPYSASQVTWATSLTILFVLSFLGLALLYAVRKGDLGWGDKK